jgi:hypothetical protein
MPRTKHLKTKKGSVLKNIPFLLILPVSFFANAPNAPNKERTDPNHKKCTKAPQYNRRNDGDYETPVASSSGFRFVFEPFTYTTNGCDNTIDAAV